MAAENADLHRHQSFHGISAPTFSPAATTSHGHHAPARSCITQQLQHKTCNTAALHFPTTASTHHCVATITAAFNHARRRRTSSSNHGSHASDLQRTQQRRATTTHLHRAGPSRCHHRVAHREHRTVRRQASSEGQQPSFTSLRQKP